jgi:sortase (surface protein transpeptidase)
MNITADSPWDSGYVTAYPAGVSRPNSSNLNISAVPQTIANHAIVRVSARGAALFTYGGAHLIADVAGWYLGTPSAATKPPPANPSYSPNEAVAVSVPKLGIYVGVRGGGGSLDAIADRGFAATWSDINSVASPGNLMLFGHRTAGSAPFRYINDLYPGDSFSVIGSDGHSYNYVVVGKDVSLPSYSQIQSFASSYGPITAQLVACSKIDGSATSLRYRLSVTGRLVSIT